jgi:hypothetical protein
MAPARHNKQQQLIRQQIAAAAARLMAEDGIDDFGHAKRKAARQLGAAETALLPTNEEIEEQLRTYHSLYQAEEQQQRLKALRSQALAVMRLLEPYRPYLCGPVLKGLAGRYSDIDLQIFTDDAKAVELLLLNRELPFEADEQRRFDGDQARAVPVLRIEWEGTVVNIAVHGANEERASVRTSPNGKAIERAPIAAVAQLVERDE